VLEEGHREEWFESSLIVKTTVVALIGFILLGIGQVHAAKHVLKLRILLNRQFGSVVIMAMVLGVVLYGSIFVIPQFLAQIANYNAFQTGQVIFLMGLPAFLIMPFVPFLIQHVDIRLVVGTSLAIMAVSCLASTGLSADSVGQAFTTGQLLRGVGLILTMMFLNQATIASVSIEDAGDASGIFKCCPKSWRLICAFCLGLVPGPTHVAPQPADGGNRLVEQLKGTGLSFGVARFARKPPSGDRIASANHPGAGPRHDL